MGPRAVVAQPEAVALFPADRPEAEAPAVAEAASQEDPPAAAAPAVAVGQSRVDRLAVVDPAAAAAVFPEAHPAAAAPAVAEAACLVWAACRCPDSELNSPTEPIIGRWVRSAALADWRL